MSQRDPPASHLRYGYIALNIELSYAQPDGRSQEENDLDSRTAADNGHVRRLQCPAPLLSENRSDASFQFHESSFWHAKHALEGVVFDAQEFLHNIAAHPVDVFFPAKHTAHFVSSMQLLRAIAHALHPYSNYRQDDECDRQCLGVIHVDVMNEVELSIYFQ